MDRFNSRLSTVDKTIRGLEEIIRNSSSSHSRVWGTHSGLKEVSEERSQCSHWATHNHQSSSSRSIFWPLWALEHTWYMDAHTHVCK